MDKNTKASVCDDRKTENETDSLYQKYNITRHEKTPNWELPVTLLAGVMLYVVFIIKLLEMNVDERLNKAFILLLSGLLAVGGLGNLIMAIEEIFDNIKILKKRS